MDLMPPPSEPLDLTQIEVRCRAASPGPWCWNSYSAVFSVPLTRADEDADAVCWVPVQAGDTATVRGEADAAFIEHSRVDVEALVAECRRLQAAWLLEKSRADRLDGEVGVLRAEVGLLNRRLKRAVYIAGVHGCRLGPVDLDSRGLVTLDVEAVP